jgi:hypothetical protein
MKTLMFFLLQAGLVFGQYKLDTAGAPPAEVAAAVGALQKTGYKVVGADGAAWCEVWLTAAVPAGPKAEGSDIAFPTIPHGALIGAIRFAANGADRRGQTIKPGVYTLRYSLYPVDGAHQGVAPQRDFLVLVPAADDKDPKSLPTYDQLVEMSRKASGTPHPAVLVIQQPQAGAPAPAVVKEGEHDWALNAKAGDTTVSIVVVGKHEG